MAACLAAMPRGTAALAVKEVTPHQWQVIGGITGGICEIRLKAFQSPIEVSA